MSEDGNKDYYGIAAVWLDAQDITVWSKVTLKTKKGTFKGILLPRGGQGDDKHLTIKLSNGYNIAINLDDIIEIKKTGQAKSEYKIPEKKFRRNPNKPTVVLLGTGGTVASRLDYNTGAVIPAFSTQELYNAFPELRDYCNLETKSVMQKFSENIEPADWIKIANEIMSIIENNDPVGIVIAHGTDTLHYTAAALSFILKNLDRPIILVGSQRSSDRPSSDTAINLLGSVNAAVNVDIAEVMVCMHATS
ncbi:MAG: asparaginase domain-containing protein, partial [Candidatus Heimdallarchaeota archaeon]